jgi:cob(I)alamin adenosyltransferase
MAQRTSARKPLRHTLRWQSAAIALHFGLAMKIYTRTGDDGTTGLLGPNRVRKHDARVEAYGSVDELNAALGVARSLDPRGALDAELALLQSALFQAGAELATVDGRMLEKLTRLADNQVDELERLIDRLEGELPALTNFILPGGGPLGAQLHFARTVCRRAERRLTALAELERIEPRLVRYLNRVADLLFVMARWVNHRGGVPETTWP